MKTMYIIDCQVFIVMFIQNNPLQRYKKIDTQENFNTFFAPKSSIVALTRIGGAEC